MLKSVVTQASSAIPVMPLYISIVFKIMKEQGIHEGCIEQIQRLFATKLYSGAAPDTDEKHRLRRMTGNCATPCRKPAVKSGSS